MEKHSNGNIQISKKSLLIGMLILVIIIVLLFYFLKLIPEKNKDKDIKIYKKALYDSILCQFTCALSPSKVQNTTVFLPDSLCQKICITELKVKNLNTTIYSEQDLLTDNLATDIEKVMSDCRKLYTKEQSPVNVSAPNETSIDIPINTTAYFPCVKQGLIDLQDKYPYISDKDVIEDNKTSEQ